MKKSDLIAGKHVVEFENGEKYFVCGDYLHCDRYGWMRLGDYQEDLTHNDADDYYSVVKVYGIKNYCGFEVLMRDDNLELLWERKKIPKLTEVEKTILSNIDPIYDYIARDKVDEDDERDVFGDLDIYEVEPVKSNGFFRADYKDDDFTYMEGLAAFRHLFKGITHENSPIKISDLLK